MTAAVIGALESELRRESEKRPLAKRLRDIARRAAAAAHIPTPRGIPKNNAIQIKRGLL